MAAINVDEMDPEEAVRFYDLQDAFPDVTFEWVRRHAFLGQQGMANLLATGGDLNEFIQDAEIRDMYLREMNDDELAVRLNEQQRAEQEPVAEVEDDELLGRANDDNDDDDSDDDDDEPVRQPVFEAFDPDDLEDVNPEEFDMTQFEAPEPIRPGEWARNIFGGHRKTKEEEKPMALSKECNMCRTVSTRYACCHIKGELPAEHADSTHVCCERCLLKNGVMLNRTWILNDKSGIICLVNKCKNVIEKEYLVEATGAYATEMMIGNLLTLSSEAEKIKVEEEKKRAREEEDPVEGIELEQLKATLRLVDKEVMHNLFALYPNIDPLWLLQNVDRGLLGAMDLINRLNDAEIPQRRKKRRDGRGSTTIIENGLRADHKFECPVCFYDFDEHLGVECVPVPGLQSEEEYKMHSFCCACIQRQTEEISEQRVLALGGGGIRCLKDGCNGLLMLSHIEQLLSRKTREMVEDCANTEALLSSGIEVEKCKRCPFAMEVAETKEVEQVFHCRRCNFEYCRRCERDWDAVHKEQKDCAELDPEGVRRRMEERLTDISVNRCKRCQRAYVRSDGCNKIQCPCGAKSCYVCQELINDYSHFKNGGCPLYSNPDQERQAVRDRTLNDRIQNADADVARELDRLR